MTAPELWLKPMTGIPMGDGSYFDFVAPDAAAMTIEDYAWALAGNARFRGQTREKGDGRRCLYSVCQHVVLLSHAMEEAGCTREQQFEGLMHESDEVAFPDLPAPVKPLIGQEARAIIAAAGAAIDRHFGVTGRHKDLVKLFDLRMLATEKRDLVPQSAGHRWTDLDGIEPFDFEITPIPDWSAVRSFLWRFEMLSAHAYTAPDPHSRRFVDDVDPAARSAAA